jgi:hypothetical protein
MDRCSRPSGAPDCYERTLLPEHPDQLEALRRFLDAVSKADGVTVLRSAEGEVVALPAEVVEGIRLVAFQRLATPGEPTGAPISWGGG